MKGKIRGDKPEEGAGLSQRPCGERPKNAQNRMAQKQLGGGPVIHAFMHICNICRVIAGCKLFHQEWEAGTARQAVLMVEYLHKSHLCESVSACGRKREGANQTGREGQKECTENSSCDFFFFSLLYSCTVITCL